MYVNKSLLKQQSSSEQKPLPEDWSQKFAELAKTARHPLIKKYYQQGLPSFDNAILECPLLALDLETTGLDFKKSEIISIGVVPLTLKRIQLSRSQHWLVKPKNELNEASILVHKITHSDIQQASTFAALAEPLLKEMAGRIMVVHCGAIERNFLARAFNQYFAEPIQFPIIDTMALEKHLQQQSPRTWLSKLLFAKPHNLDLSSCRKKYHLPNYRLHHALSDALSCAELLHSQFSYGFAELAGIRPLCQISDK